MLARLFQPRQVMQPLKVSAQKYVHPRCIIS